MEKSKRKKKIIQMVINWTYISRMPKHMIDFLLYFFFTCKPIRGIAL